MTPSVYTPTCRFKETIYGVGATVDAATGNIVDQGTVHGTFVSELGGWPSHEVTSYVNAILLQEVLGYDMSFVYATGTYSTERMSTMGRGLCTPTHLNLEVWTASQMSTLKLHANESTMANVGYWGRSGHYTLRANVEDALRGRQSALGNLSRPFSADFWREFTLGDDLIEYFSIDRHNRSRIAKPAFCPDGIGGCLDGCSKSHACTLNESQGKPCMLVLIMRWAYDPGYLQAIMSNHNVPAYFCSAGDSNLQNYVVETMQRNGTITFYHYEPDMFHIGNSGKFARIMWPLPDPAVVAAATGTYGELGYGNATTNPVNVDYPQENLMKIYSNLLRSDEFLSHYLNQFTLTQLDVTTMLSSMAQYQANGTQPANFAAACAWVRSNYDTWTSWIDNLPLCDIRRHVTYAVAGCNDTVRSVSFKWTRPDPSNASMPFECDGGMVDLPMPFETSKSCTWLDTHESEWTAWTSRNVKPTCDPSYFAYTVSPCSDASTRQVTFAWHLPVADNAAMSSECSGGVSLPQNVEIDCEYVPYNSSAYVGISVFASVVIGVLTVLTAFVLYFRERPIIKRSQWPLLKAMKRVVITVWRALQWFLVVLGVDIGIVVTWLVVDFPHPITVTAASSIFHGDVDIQQCHSSNFIFPTLSIFWKGLVTMGGVYVAFHIRKADGDFQESVWMFASSCIVIVGGGVMLPLTYATTMSPASVFTIQAVLILLCTVAVMALMLIPKFFKLHAVTPIEVFPSRKTMSNASSTSIFSTRKPSAKAAAKPTSQRLSSGSQMPQSNSGAPAHSSSASLGVGQEGASEAPSTS